MDIQISFPGGKRVDAQVGRHVVRTDQPAPVGDGSAVAPFELFLASIGTCAGIYALGFCEARGLPTQGLALRQSNHFHPDGRLARVDLEVTLPAGFPRKYEAAILRAAEECKVQRTLFAPPEFHVRAAVAADQAAKANPVAAGPGSP